MTIARLLSFVVSLFLVATVSVLLESELILESILPKRTQSLLYVNKSDTAPNGEAPTRIFFLHVGPHKTGTTTIQDSFDTNPAFEKDKCKFLGMRNPPPQRDTFGVRSGLRQFRQGQGKSNVFLDSLSQEIKQEDVGNLIVSAEDFSLMLRAVDSSGISFFKLLANRLQGWDIQVAVGYRRYYEWLISLYNQRHRTMKHDESFVWWYRNAANTPGGHGLDCYRTYSKMKEFFSSVTVINMHAPGDLMTNVYCHILPNATNSCAWYKQKLEKEATEDIHNPSVPLWPITVAEEAKRRHYKSALQPNIHDHIVNFANEINYTVPLTCISSREEQEILETSLRYEKAIVPEFFQSPLGEQELRKGFEKAVKDKKFCSINTTHVFQDEQWLEFFRGNDFADER